MITQVCYKTKIVPNKIFSISVKILYRQSIEEKERKEMVAFKLSLALLACAVGLVIANTSQYMDDLNQLPQSGAPHIHDDVESNNFNEQNMDNEFTPLAPVYDYPGAYQPMIPAQGYHHMPQQSQCIHQPCVPMVQVGPRRRHLIRRRKNRPLYTPVSYY